MPTAATVKVWDPLVRVFHWVLVLAVTLAFVTEDEWMSLHLAAGFTVIALIGIRLLWGVVGTSHARFDDFVHPPRTVAAYIKDIFKHRARRHLGHNPAGGAMVLALLAVLLATTISGVLIWQGAGGLPLLGPYLSGYSLATLETIEELHEALSSLLLLLIAAHVAGVVLASLQHRENLVRAMFNGRKRSIG